MLVMSSTLGLLAGAAVSHAQQPPVHVFSGGVFIDGTPVSDGTAVTAWIDGNVVAKTMVEGGEYTLTLKQPPGQSYAGKIVTFRAGEVQTGVRREWKKDAETIVNLDAYIRGSGPPGSTDRVPGRFIRECVLNALGRLPSSVEDMAAPELIKANQLCPSLKGRGGALRGGSGARPAPDSQPAADVSAHIFQGKALISGEPAEDGTGVTAYIDGVRISGTKTNGGRFRLVVPQAQGRSFVGRFVEFRGVTAQGRRFEWLAPAAWTGSETSITLGPEVRFASGGQSGGGPVGNPVSIPDPVTLECVRGVLGYLPATGPREMTQEQLDAAGSACPGLRGRMGQVLNPRAVDQSNRECAQRVLGYLPPNVQAMTAEETQRVQAACLGGRSIPDDPTLSRDSIRGEPIPSDPAPSQDPIRGFFTNSASGNMSDLNNLLDPTMLAVLGILLTLVATSLSLVKGS
ncbi:MAG: hypothetical protein BZY80_05195 [SAR202 cluster bacterium Io17-Chloro-G2]|nr:MAG: hypothetical protein BZY80_05195 [SAR202 cluster bacterium Io17-Chloro-G2]